LYPLGLGTQGEFWLRLNRINITEQIIWLDVAKNLMATFDKEVH
jgi:hypothetical protein